MESMIKNACKWICCADELKKPFIAAYRREFVICDEVKMRIFVSADERYDLFLDGKRIGRGSERGDRDNWFYETYEINFKPGRHVIAARTWSLGDLKPWAQLTVHSGFILTPENDEYISVLGTGVAEWQAKVLEGYQFRNPSEMAGVCIGTGAKLVIDGNCFSWGFETGEGEGWNTARIIENEDLNNKSRTMAAGSLPQMLCKHLTTGRVRYVGGFPSPNTKPALISSTNDLIGEHGLWDGMLSGEVISIPGNCCRRIIIDLKNYYCAYPEITISGGKDSLIFIHWAESLYDVENNANTCRKGNRDEIFDKAFVGIGDAFISGGGDKCRYDTLWWHAGRYIEFIVETGDETLYIDKFRLEETRYPLKAKSTFTCDNEKINKIKDISLRTLEMCAHEILMDCPYFEQMMYIGDTMNECIVLYTLGTGDRLIEKSLKLFDASRSKSGGVPCCAYPGGVPKIIPSFCLWYVSTVYNHALWRNNPKLVQLLMPGVRAVIERFLLLKNEYGLLSNMEGWNYIDWPHKDPNNWQNGSPPQDQFNCSSIINWQMALALKQTAELEAYLGELERAEKMKKVADELSGRIINAFWSKGRNLFSDDLAHKYYSEHAQSLAILSNSLTAECLHKLSKAMENTDGITETSIFYTHQLFEAYRLLKRSDLIFERLNMWSELVCHGFKTLPEGFTPDSRSDCHAWGTHPIYHFFATILGIRPYSMGFKSVAIRPQPGILKELRGSLAHPQGHIVVELYINEKYLSGRISLPGTLHGIFEYEGNAIPLHKGEQEIQIRL